MPGKLSVTINKNINAPVSKVWDALVNPEIIRQYLHGTEALSEWKKGSQLLFKGEWKGKSYMDKGIILDIEKEKLLRYTWLSSFSGLEDKPENYTTIAYHLSDEGNFTHLTLVQDNIKSAEGVKASEDNWEAVLTQLKNLLEK